MAIPGVHILCVKKIKFDLFEVKCCTLRINSLISLMRNEWVRRRTKTAVAYLRYFSGFTGWPKKEQDG
jgi:hypothetical protein